MKALTPAALTPRGGSLRLLRLAFPPFRSQPRVPSEGRFLSRLSAFGHSRLRHHPAGSPRVHAESDSCSYRLAVRLRLLPTPAHADAVAFGYMVTTLHDGDSHPADKTYSQTHWMAGTSPAMTRKETIKSLNLTPMGTSPGMTVRESLRLVTVSRSSSTRRPARPRPRRRARRASVVRARPRRPHAPSNRARRR